MQIEKSTRIFIIEGIAGSGKNTLHRELKEKLSDKLIYDFSEEELLFSWRHIWIDNINEMRITFYENFLSYCQTVLSENPDAVFILNRFHISCLLLSNISDNDLKERYNNIIERLKTMSPYIFVPILDESLIEERSIHTERIDPIWRIHLQKRLAQKNCKTLTEMYSKEQENIKKILKEQNIPYSFVNVDIKKI